MDPQTRKLDIIERLLHLDTEEAIATVERVMAMLEASIPGEDDIPVMPARSQEEIAANLAQSQVDARAGRTFTTEEVVALTQRWRKQ